ncbi:hypothetical protein K504DRAFT_457806 [Pleomassaria siparia CBS 279.74]|uniref:Uncharacterized protein n=1 Tax=Pleomassaria siparia CBS 279.74 TaxID=1314801 RepID=A0A6G1KRY7_9PLEO|nr:hypothetical protein K504DRAFT_457806 [Pleomassaria siparia CBS 279.74]
MPHSRQLRRHVVSNGFLGSVFVSSFVCRLTEFYFSIKHDCNEHEPDKLWSSVIRH